ncbi:phage major capsid protein [Pseudomonadota bacterium]
MNISEMSDRIDQLGKAWEHFKKINDERIAQIEKKGSSDPLTVNQLQKINDAIDEQKSKLTKIETALSRPNFDSKSNEVEDGEELEYKNAFSNYIRKGVDSGVANIELKALTTDTGSGSYGGYLVTPNMQRIISGNLTKNSVMRKICSVQEISTSSLDIIDDDDTFTTTWAASETTPVSDSATANILKKSIPTHELVAQPQVTQKLIDDSVINIEEWLAKRLSDTLLEAEENVFINGTGSTQPTGILNYNHGTTSSTIEHVTSAETVDGTFTVDELLL